MLNINYEKEKLKDWLNGVDTTAMQLDDLAQLAVNGLPDCEDCKLFQKYIGEDGCTCIRSIFPHPEHYHLYLKLREIAVELAAIAFLGGLNDKRKTEGNFR